jgi:hypothetical protein
VLFEQHACEHGSFRGRPRSIVFQYRLCVRSVLWSRLQNRVKKGQNLTSAPPVVGTARCISHAGRSGTSVLPIFARLLPLSHSTVQAASDPWDLNRRVGTFD